MSERDDRPKSSTKHSAARFAIGQVVRHRIFPFRGVIFDVDPVFNNTEEWWQAIPEEIRPAKEQPFYHLFAENEESEYVAYVSEQNLLADESDKPLRHPRIGDVLEKSQGGGYRLRPGGAH
jgi:heat shock protein HspQ